VVELETLYTHWRKGAKDEMNAGIHVQHIANVTSDPLYAFVRFFHSGQAAPVGVNWGFYSNPKPRCPDRRSQADVRFGQAG